MIPFPALLAVPPYVAQDAGLSWSFDGAVRREKGRYALTGPVLRGEIAWFVAPKGRYDAAKLYESDTAKTQGADEAADFRHTRKDDLLAGTLAIRSDQTYRWDGVPVASRCLYAAKGNRAWVVRLWWPPASKGSALADAFLKSVKALPRKP